MNLFSARVDADLPCMGRISAELLQERLHGSPLRRSADVKLLPCLNCTDGFSLSFQASEIHSSQPKRRDGPYSHVECACPSKTVPLLMPSTLRKDGIPPEQPVYRNVPIAIVHSILNAHGGLRA